MHLVCCENVMHSPRLQFVYYTLWGVVVRDKTVYMQCKFSDNANDVDVEVKIGM